MEVFKVTLAIVILIVPFACAGLWWWVAFWVVLAIILGIFELLSLRKNKKTLSQKFWDWKKTANKKQKYCVLWGMLIFGTYLILHLFLSW